MIRKMHYSNITYLCDSDCKFCAANIGLIDSKGYTISANQFELQLLKENVQEGDIVMISGGEPTLSPSFWEILDICKKYRCNIELTTNGHSFADFSCAQRLYEYKNVNVQIPLLGLEEQHDYLTGYRGGFSKTIRALDNFAELIEDNHFTLSINFLLSKATVEGNKMAYAFAKKRYGRKYKYYLKALLVSEKVKCNSSELLEPYSDTLKKLEDFLENEDINVDTIPLCLLSEGKRNTFLKQKHLDLTKIYSDAKTSDIQIDNYKGNKCDLCKLNRYCDRFLLSYIEYYGETEINPL